MDLKRQFCGVLMRPWNPVFICSVIGVRIFKKFHFIFSKWRDVRPIRYTRPVGQNRPDMNRIQLQSQARIEWLTAEQVIWSSLWIFCKIFCWIRLIGRKFWKKAWFDYGMFWSMTSWGTNETLNLKMTETDTFYPLIITESNELVTDNTVYGIGSITKQFTTTLLGKTLKSTGTYIHCLTISPNSK